MTMGLFNKYTCFLVTLVVLTACGSNWGSDGKGPVFFSDYGRQPDDIVAIEISSPQLNNGWSDNTSAGSIGTVESPVTTGSIPVLQNQRKITLDLGTSTQFSVTARDVTGNRYENVQVKWTSDNSGIVAVDNNIGKITGVSPGSATITANVTMADGTTITDSVLVTVFQSPVPDKKWVKSAKTLPRAMWDHASTIWGGYLYVSGGHSDCAGDSDYKDCGFSNMIYFSSINQDGSMGGFTNAGTMPFYLRGHSLLSYNGFIYLLGGIVQFPPPCILTDSTCILPTPDPNTYTHGPNDTILNEKVYVARINPNGTIGIWHETSPLQLPELSPDLQDKAGLFAHSATLVNGYIYVTGGWNVEQKKNVKTVLIGTIDTNSSSGTYGSVKVWLNSPGFDLPYNLSKHASVAVNVNGDNYLYVIGGNSGDLDTQEFHDTILYSKIAADGIPGPWKQTSNNLPMPLIDHAAVSLDRYIFVFGGRGGDDSSKSGYKAYSDVYYYSVNDTGDIEVLNKELPMPSPLFHHTAVTDTNGNIYVTGGASGDTEDTKNRHDDVYYLTETTP